MALKTEVRKIYFPSSIHFRQGSEENLEEGKDVISTYRIYGLPGVVLLPLVPPVPPVPEPVALPDDVPEDDAPL